MRFLHGLETPPPELDPDDEPEEPEEPDPVPPPKWGPARTGRFWRWF